MLTPIRRTDVPFDDDLEHLLFSPLYLYPTWESSHSTGPAALRSATFQQARSFGIVKATGGLCVV